MIVIGHQPVAPIALIASSLARVLLADFRVVSMCSIRVGKYGKMSLSAKKKLTKITLNFIYTLY